MRLKAVLVLILLGLCIQDLSAQLIRGCRRSGIIYDIPPVGLYGWTGGISENCPANATSSTTVAQFIQNVPAAPACPIGLLSLGGSGTLVDFRIISCSLDKISTLLIFPVVLIALSRIKKGP